MMMCCGGVTIVAIANPQSDRPSAVPDVNARSSPPQSAGATAYPSAAVTGGSSPNIEKQIVTETQTIPLGLGRPSTDLIRWQ